MAHINRRYIDSHWLIFVIKGIFSAIFGWILLFSASSSYLTATSLVSIFLLALSVIEFINALYRAHMRTGWFISVLVAIFDAAASLAILFAPVYSPSGFLYPTIFFTISAFTIIRGVSEIIIGFRTTVDPTDRAIWIITGISGTVMGVAILNSGNFSDPSLYARFFGSYILIFGLANLIYGIHNREQKIEDLAARRETAKTARVLATLSKSSPKPTKKSPKKTKKSKKSR